MPSQITPSVSIITPLYNSEKYIADTISSVLVQTYSDWEMIIVDDCSTDDSVDIVHDFAKTDIRIKLIRLGYNSGPAIARNTAIEAAKGRYIAFLDSDDLWHRKKLDTQLALFKKTYTPLVYSAYEKIDEHGRKKGGVVPVPEYIDYSGLLNATVIATVTAMYDTAKVGKIFMPNILKRQDYGLWLCILRKGNIAHAVNQPLAYLRKRPGSLSSNKISAIWYTWRVYRELEHLSLARSLYHFTNYCTRAFLKNL